MSERVCAVPGCDEKVHCRGMCMKHYTQWQREKDGPLKAYVAPASKGGRKKKAAAGSTTPAGPTTGRMRHAVHRRPAGTMLNIIAVANRIVEATELLTGDRVQSMPHSAGHILINPDNGKMAYLDGEGHVKPASIEIDRGV